MTLIPLVQHFESYDGNDVSTTAARFIALKSLPSNMWLKLDAKMIFDWEHNKEWFESEMEFGKMLSPNFGVFAQGLVGVGHDRVFDWGIGVGLRFMF